MLALTTWLAAFATALLLGGMVMFAGVAAPTVFRTLDEAAAGRLIRALFPPYYALCGALAGAAALAAAPTQPWLALVMALVAAGFVLARHGLMPRINALRDAHLDGDAAAGARFRRLHRVSVVLNAGQAVAAAAVLGIFLA